MHLVLHPDYAFKTIAGDAARFQRMLPASGNLAQHWTARSRTATTEDVDDNVDNETNKRSK